jgi:hypothetical protein
MIDSTDLEEASNPGSGLTGRDAAPRWLDAAPRWLDALNSFLDRAYLQADRDTGF